MPTRWLVVSKPLTPPWRDGSVVLARDLVQTLDPGLWIDWFGVPGLRERGEALPWAPMGLAPTWTAKARLMAALLHPDRRRHGLHLVFTPSRSSGLAARVLRAVGAPRPLLWTVPSSGLLRSRAELARAATAVVVTSDRARQRLLGDGMEPDRVTRIYPGVAPAEAREARGSRRLLYAGDLNRHVAARLQRVASDLPAGWTLSLACRPKWADHDELLRGLEGTPNLELLGVVVDLGAVLAETALQLLLDVDTLFKVDVPFSLLEGWARGVPVVGLDVPAWREPFRVAADLGLTPGRLVAEWNLGAAIEEGIEAREAWGRDARELAQTAFSLEAAAEAYARVYAGLRG